MEADKWHARNVRLQRGGEEKAGAFNETTRSQLASQGFAVISAVLRQDECAKAVDLAWDFVEAASKAKNRVLKGDYSNHVDRADPDTWHNGNWPRCVEGGIIPFCGAGQSRCAWYVRSHHKIREVFAGLWQTEDLVVSFDGLLLWRDWRTLNRMEYRTEEGWFHIDQNPRKKQDFCCVQGLVNLLPNSGYIEGNVLVAGSHLSFPHHFLQHTDEDLRTFYLSRLDQVQDEDWLEVHPKDSLLHNNVICCHLDAGDLLLWDSRVVHCSYPSAIGATREEQAELSSGDRMVLEHAKGLTRAAVMVCYVPAERVDARIKEERVEAVGRGATLSHWPDKLQALGAEQQADAEKEREMIEDMMQTSSALLPASELSDEQWKLVYGRDCQ
ncbi:hypothetical protein GUITHDRAFT_134183 [Guillardia theta CCMP2712]|uniref:Phytanoyl-CoA dioxygenase n=2 Tax=Guillardia theta TaxID=55529 RepID=L1JTG7_GUITC|nr:hypothetical protein GUITHDRAFT_134183 [Guillardia theta CCMP2712]EKX51841.1 hypothetical protein GUITHDRAFT_134183 [Guillardia theta CCMP2712]|eukprot:XP_005838821.1 hypothetical protein GUITHDRAFT_134183 [Guillardia theta CCMP2712]